MAQPVYSSVLVSVSTVQAGGWLQLAAVPSGFVWVVRHVSAFNVGTPPHGLRTLLLGDSNLVPLWGVGFPRARAGQWFGDTIHQALAFGDSLWVNATDSGWQLRVSGFKLTSP